MEDVGDAGGGMAPRPRRDAQASAAARAQLGTRQSTVDSELESGSVRDEGVPSLEVREPRVQVERAVRGVRDDRYKLMHFYVSNEWELFDLEEDPQPALARCEGPRGPQVEPVVFGVAL